MKHLKLMLLAACALVLGLTSCEPENEKTTVTPTVTITAGEVSGSSLTFSIETKDATTAAWLVVPATENTPSAEDVLKNGSAISVNKVETITAPGLTAATEYIVAAAATGSSEGVTAVNSIRMTTGEKGMTLQLQITMGEITYDQASYVVTATEQETPYYFNILEASEAEGFRYQDFIAEWETIASAQNKSIYECLVDSGLIYTGNQEGTVTKLTPSTAYVAMAFGFDENNAMTSEIATTEFETAALEYPLLITVELGTPTPNAVPIDVTVNDESLSYILQAVYTKNIQGLTDEEVFEAYMGYFAENAAYYDMSVYEFLGAAGYLMQGNVSGEFNSLMANTEYTVIGWGLNEKSKLISPIVREEFKTPNTEDNGMTFDMRVENITETSARLIITPSDPTATFVWLCQPLQDPDWTAETIMNDYVNSWAGFLNAGMGLDSGNIDYTSKTLVPGLDYYFIAFGYDGGITSAPNMIVFKTLTGADENSFDCEFVVEKLDAHNVTLRVIPNYNSIYYLFGAVPDGTLDIEETKAWIEESIALGFDEFIMMNPSFCLADYINYTCYNGDTYGTISELEEKTSYTVFAIPVTVQGLTTERHVVEEGFFTTPEFRISTAEMTNEFHKVFDGNDVTAQGLFDGADVRGRGVMTMSFEANNDAVQLYHYISDGDITSTEEYPDEWLWSNVPWYELEGGIEENPYGFYVIDWSYTYTVLTVARDAEGFWGVVDRTKVTPRKGNISPIEELIDILNSYETPSRYCVAPETLGAQEELTPMQPEIQAITRKGFAR